MTRDRDSFALRTADGDPNRLYLYAKLGTNQ